MLRILCIVLLTGGLAALSQAQNTPKKNIYLTDGRAEVSNVFRPRSPTDADLFYLYIRKYQEISISVGSNSVYLSKENECGMYFRLFDDKGIETKIGDAPAGVDSWSGYVEKAGMFKIKVQMGCLESFTLKQLTAKKPVFKYDLKIYQRPASSR
ncbi:hypothetical protein BH10ACI3_BH10ACI3_18480 [soil metagenome]